eukprot:augustus_masked-scaffold_73-processed-gene-0.51-mRNA-1 protein AED:0.04 eAED:0.04 QI:0/-1/0/1/-1/1/1/0/91
MPRRAFSDAAHDEHVKTMEFWKKVTMGALPVLGLLGVVNAYWHFAGHHDHEEETPQYSYLRFRKKKYPWSCGDCDLFDIKCWEKCKAEGAN